MHLRSCFGYTEALWGREKRKGKGRGSNEKLLTAKKTGMVCAENWESQFRKWGNHVQKTGIFG
eukprot:4520128-Pleurochrysis_carterae.AAC.1